MLWQIHHQFSDGHTKFVSQIELLKNDDRNKEIIHKAVEEAWDKYPLPEGAVFVIGNEEWEHFSWVPVS